MSSPSFIEKMLTYAISTFVQLPFHLIIASPWIVVALAFAFFSRRWVPNLTRNIVATGIAAVGLTPVYGAHLSMVPMYVLVASGDVTVAVFLASFLGTWGLVFSVALFVQWVAKLRNHKCNEKT